MVLLLLLLLVVLNHQRQHPQQQYHQYLIKQIAMLPMLPGLSMVIQSNLPKVSQQVMLVLMLMLM
jgi:hypothetical protein